MAAKSAGSQSAKRNISGPDQVESFLESLQHPFKPEILALRQIILAADPSIAEAIKWNAPSFHTSEHFATMHLRAKDGVQLILHLGAKARGDTAPGLAIADPEGLLAWLGKDRASVMFRDLDEIQARRAALTDIIRQWISYVR